MDKLCFVLLSILVVVLVVSYVSIVIMLIRYVLTRKYFDVWEDDWSD